MQLFDRKSSLHIDLYHFARDLKHGSVQLLVVISIKWFEKKSLKSHCNYLFVQQKSIWATIFLL